MEIKLIAIAIAILALAGGGFYEGWSHGSAHVQAAWNVDKLAQDKALGDAQAKLLEAQKARDTLQTVVEKDHEDISARDAQLIALDSQRVHDIAAALRASALSGAVGHPTESRGAPAVSGSNGKATIGLEQLSADISAVEQAGYHDSAELMGILALVPKP